jgi:hypothetical protein
MRYRLLWASAILGVAIHGVGLFWDLYLHSHDANLAAEEGILTLENPGHLLIVIGLALTGTSVFAVGWTWISDRTAGRTGIALRAARSLAGVGAIALTAFGISMTIRAEDANHEHQLLEAAGVHDHGSHAGGHAPTAVELVATRQHQAAARDHHTHPSATGTEAPADGAPHFLGSEVRVSEEHMRRALAFVDQVRAANERFKDVRQALAEGYVQATQDLEGIAAHFVRLDYLDDDRLADPDRPEVLLYTKRLDGTWRMVGVMFQTRSDGTLDSPAPNLFGGLDAWHYHENLCFTTRGVTTAKDAASCRGTFTKRTGWELHVWTEPGAEGIFAHDYAPIRPGTFPPATQAAAVEVGFVKAQAR